LVSFISQIFGGFGAGALSTCSMSLVGTFENEEREKYIGWIEAANGLGLLFGPVLGSGLYSLGGYAMPFLLMASLLTVSFPYVSIQFTKCQEEAEEL
jgi:MFS family permease